MKIFGILIALTAGAVALVASPVSYTVRVDTSSISTQNGIVYLAFATGTPEADNALAGISGFSTDGTFSGVVSTDGTVIPANADFTGDFGISNDPTQNSNGNYLNFVLTLSGDAFDNPNAANTSGSTFAVTFYTPGFGGTLLTDSTDGAVLDVQVAANGGAVTPQTFNPAVVDVATTPEPGTVGLIGGGLLAMFGMRRWRPGRGKSLRR
jgi:hypothetical protein